MTAPITDFFRNERAEYFILSLNMDDLTLCDLLDILRKALKQPVRHFRETLVISELIATLNGHPDPDYPVDYDLWISINLPALPLSGESITLAINAISKILTDEQIKISLRSLGYPQWFGKVIGLLSRLNMEPGDPKEITKMSLQKAELFINKMEREVS